MTSFATLRDTPPAPTHGHPIGYAGDYGGGGGVIVGPTPTVHAVTYANASSSAALAVAKPAGASAGDVIVLNVAYYDSTVTPACSGFTFVGSAGAPDSVGSGTDTLVGALVRTLNGSEGSTFVVTFATSVYVDITCLLVKGASGAVNATSEDDSAGAYAAGFNIPAITTTSDNCLVIACWGAWNDAVTGYTGWTYLENNPWSLTFHRELAAAGTLAATTLTGPDTDQWAVFVLALEPPTTPVAGTSELRFALELATPAPAAPVLGSFTLGTDVLTPATWQDVTGYAEGVEFRRGAPPPNRPETGELVFRLQYDDDAPEQFAPFASVHYGPGTLVRLVTFDTDNAEVYAWDAQFTGVVESWEEGSDALGTYRWVDVVVVEYFAMTMAQVNDPALTTAEGEDDDVEARLTRLITAAEPELADGLELLYDDAATFARLFQATTMANNRLAELFLTVDSIDWTIHTAKNGGARAFERGSVASGWVLSTAPDPTDVPIVADTLATENDDELALASVILGQVGSTQRQFDAASVRRHFRRRTFARGDLITRDLYSGADLAHVASRMLARSEESYRPLSCVVDVAHARLVLDWIIGADIGELVTVEDAGRVEFVEYGIAQLHHRISPLSDGAVTWTVDVMFSVEHPSYTSPL